MLYLYTRTGLLLLKVVFTQVILTSVNICYWTDQCYQPKFSEKIYIFVMWVNKRCEAVKLLLKLSSEYLVNGKLDVFIQFLLRVNSLWATVLITLQEEVFKCGCVFLLKSHHNLVT